MRWILSCLLLLACGCSVELAPTWLTPVPDVSVRSAGGGARLSWSAHADAVAWRVYQLPGPHASVRHDGVELVDGFSTSVALQELEPGVETWLTVAALFDVGSGIPVEGPPSPVLGVIPGAVGSIGPYQTIWEASAGTQATTGYGGVIAAADVTSDGQVDLLVSDSSLNTVFYYEGTGTGFLSTANSVSGLGRFGSAVVTGDLDMDGLPDLVVASPERDMGAMDTGRVSIFAGGPGGIPSQPSAWVDGVVENLELGGALAVGPLQGAGAQLAVTNRGGNGGLTLYEVGGDPLTFTAFWTPTSAGSGVLGGSLAVGDFAGDTWVDLAATVVGTPGEIVLYRADANGLATQADIVATYDTVHPNAEVASGDFDNNGVADLVYADRGGDGGAGLVDVFWGSSLSIGVEYRGEGTGTRFGENATAGDLDGDGYDDLIIGAQAASGGGAIFLYAGGPDGLPPSATHVISGAEFAAVGLGDAQALVDVNGDGTPELVAGDQDWVGASFGRVLVLATPPRLGPDLRVSAIAGDSLEAVLQIVRYRPPLQGEDDCLVEWGGEAEDAVPCASLSGMSHRFRRSGNHDIRVTATGPGAATTRTAARVRVLP